MAGKYGREPTSPVGGGDPKTNLAETPQYNKNEHLKAREIVGLTLGRLYEALSELDDRTVWHSIGMVALASVLMDELQKEFQAQAGAAENQTETSTASLESQNITLVELWYLLYEHMEIFLLFILLHDYGKRHIGDIVNSSARFSDEVKTSAETLLNRLNPKLNQPSVVVSKDNHDSSFSAVISILGIWTFPGVHRVLLEQLKTPDGSASQSTVPQSGAEAGSSENSLREQVTDLLKEFIQIAPNTDNPTAGELDSNAIDMVINWILIKLHPGQGLLEIAPTVIETLQSSREVSSKQKAITIAIMIGVIAGHHTPGGTFGYPPTEVLVSVLEHCLGYLGISGDEKFVRRITHLMLIAAAVGRVIDVMQAACFDNRSYQTGERPSLTSLKFTNEGHSTVIQSVDDTIINQFVKTVYSMFLKSMGKTGNNTTGESEDEKKQRFVREFEQEYNVFFEKLMSLIAKSVQETNPADSSQSSNPNSATPQPTGMLSFGGIVKLVATNGFSSNQDNFDTSQPGQT